MRHLWMIGLLAACDLMSGPDARPTGSATIVATTRTATMNVNPTEGTVSWTDHERGEVVSKLFVGLEPVRLATVGDEVWVTLRGERGIAIVGVEGTDLQLIDRFDAGVEPYGIVADRQGQRVFVASAMTDEVLVIDAETRSVVGRHRVSHEPRWLALHPSGKSLFVGAVREGRLYQIDLASGEVTRIQLPGTIRFSRDGVIDLKPRITGDLSITPDGASLGVPVLYVDNTTPVVSSPGGDREPVFPGEVPQPADSGYGSSGGSVSRLNPGLATFELDGQGDVQDSGDAVFVSAPISHVNNGFVVPFGEEFGSGTEGEFGVSVRSFPSSVTATRDAWFVTMEGSDALLVVHRKGAKKRNEHDIHFADVESGDFVFTSTHEAGFASHEVIAIEMEAEGPRGAVLMDDRIVVHGAIGRSVQSMDAPALFKAVDQMRSRGFTSPIFEVNDSRAIFVETKALSGVEAMGEALFFSAKDARMAGTGAGVSCSTCHFDGRNDGLTWTVDGQVRQTPSLAGNVSETAPVTWTNDVPSVADEAMLTTSQRMGGEGLSPLEAQAIQAFVDSTPYPDPPELGTGNDAVSRGKAIFEDPAVGCASCHSGPTFTDNRMHQVLDLAVQTPTLRGVAASAPYFHDGSMLDLTSVVYFARTGQMGDTSGLDDAAVNDLVAYLKSL